MPLETNPENLLHQYAQQGKWDKVASHASAPQGGAHCSPLSLTYKDTAGNTLLHLAVEAGRRDIVQLLLRNGADPRIKNAADITPVVRAAQLQDRPMTEMLYRSCLAWDWKSWCSKVPYLCITLERIPDCVLHLQWAAVSHKLPGLGSILPSDDVTLAKTGSCVRLDWSFSGYDEKLKKRRGKCSLLFWGNRTPKQGQVWYIDHDKNTFQDALERTRDPSDDQIDESVDGLLDMAKYNCEVSVDTSKISLHEASSRWGRSNKEVIHGYRCSRYTLQNASVNFSYQDVAGTTATRQEKKNNHDVEDVETLAERLMLDDVASCTSRTSSNSDETDDAAKEIRKRWSLFHRSKRDKNGKHHFNWKAEASVWMTQDFPFALQDLLPLLDVVAHNHPRVQKVRDFLEMKLPEGFPVKIDIPILCGVHAEVIFLRADQIAWPDKEFRIPENYTLYQPSRSRYSPSVPQPD